MRCKTAVKQTQCYQHSFLYFNNLEVSPTISNKKKLIWADCKSALFVDN